MAIREDVIIATTSGLTEFSGGGTQYVIQTPTGVLYMVYIDYNGDPSFRTSTNNGYTWSTPVVLKAITATQLSVWYDRWSGIAAGKIHCAYTDSGVSDVFYRSIDTEAADALGTETVIFAGASTAAGGALSITKARGGRLACAYMIDAGVELGFKTSADAGATWVAKTSCMEATTDMIILLPGWAADNQDLMAFYWDASADEISRKLYDDSANSWAEASIATSMVDWGAATDFPNFAASVDITNSRNLLVAWSAVDSANADLRCWHITESVITEVTNVVLNSVDDQALCGIGIDQKEWWYVFYSGKSDGSETFSTSLNIYYKVSKDSGITWGPETLITSSLRSLAWLVCTPRFTDKFFVVFHNDIAIDEIMINIPTSRPKTTCLIGM